MTSGMSGIERDSIDATLSGLVNVRRTQTQGSAGAQPWAGGSTSLRDLRQFRQWVIITEMPISEARVALAHNPRLENELPSGSPTIP